MNEKEIYELKEFIWINVFGWVHWQEENYPYRDGFSIGGVTGEKCLQINMLDPLSPEGAMRVLKKCLDVMKRHGEVFGIEIAIQSRGGRFNVCCSSPVHALNETEEDSLELSICQFAKKIFKQ